MLPGTTIRVLSNQANFCRNSISMVEEKVLKKKDRIISKTASKYWKNTHKYRLRITHTVKEAIDIDKENGDTLCWDAILH